jgi:cysteine-rich repeat protein
MAHCDVNDSTCQFDPAVSRTQQAACVLNAPAVSLQCTAVIDGQKQQVQYELAHPGVTSHDTCRWPHGKHTYPLVVVAHGAGAQDFQQYTDLLEHLAFNGFIAASIRTTPLGTNTTTASQRADYIEAFVDCVNTASKSNSILPRWNGRLAVVGHSRGAESAARLAQSDTFPPDGVHLDALVTLSPANGENTMGSGVASDQQCSEGPWLRGRDVPNLLTIDGALDQDTGARGSTYFDGAASEWPWHNIDVMDRTHVWLSRGRHDGWIEKVQADGNTTAIPSTALSNPTHHAVLRAYTNAFLRWVMFDDAEYRSLLTGEAISPTVQAVADNEQDGTVEIYVEHSAGPDVLRRVIDHAECSEFCGGPDQLECWRVRFSRDDETVFVYPSDEVIAIEAPMQHLNYADVADPEGPYKHQRSRALLLRWDLEASGPANAPKLTFRLDEEVDWRIGYGDANQTPGGPDNDVRFFSHLTFRVSQLPDAIIDGFDALGAVNGDPTDPASLQPIDFYVELADNKGQTQRIRVSDVGAFQSPTGTPNPFVGQVPYADTDYADDGTRLIRPHFQTIRIPLRAFCNVDLTDLARISFELDADHDTIGEVRSLRGAIALDNVEFIREPPNDANGPIEIAVAACPHICGNGVVDPTESCDDANLIDDDACPNNCAIPAPPAPGPGAFDCQPGDPGCPGGPCIETPRTEGEAAHARDRFCYGESSICRPDGDDWICQNCDDPDYTGVGCPCHDVEGLGPACATGLNCIGAAPLGTGDQPLGSCWAEAPEGLCLENCGLCGRTCSSTESSYSVTMCVSPQSTGCNGFSGGAGEDPHCEPQGLICSADGDCQTPSAECESDCDCLPGMICAGGACQ